MIQVFQRPESYLEQILPAAGRGLTAAVQTGVKGYQQRQDRAKDQEIIGTLGNEKSPLDFVKKIGALSKEGQAAFGPILENVIKGQQQQQLAAQKQQQDQASFEQKRADAIERQQAQFAHNEAQQRRGFENTANIAQEKEAAQKSEAIENASATKNTLDRLRELNTYTGAARHLTGAFPRKAVEERAEYDQLAFSLEGYLRDLAKIGKGPGQQIFAKLLERLPNSKLSDRENEGRIKGIETKIRQFYPELFKINEQQIDEFLKQANNDPKKAEALAKKAGYTF